MRQAWFLRMEEESDEVAVQREDATQSPGAVFRGFFSTESVLSVDNTSEPNSSPDASLTDMARNASASFFERDEALARAEIAVMAIILYLALFGNIFVLVVLRLRRQKLTRMQWFIVHLSLADIFVGIFHVLPQMLMDITNQFYGDDFLCRFVRYVNVVAMYASSYVLLMAAIDRYVSICHPLTNQTLSPKRIHLMILLAWGLAIVFSIPQLIIFRLQNMGNNEFDCYAIFNPEWGLKAYVTWVFISVYVVPFFILAFCYSRICHVVWVSVAAKQGKNWSVTETSEGKRFVWRVSFKNNNGNMNTGIGGSRRSGSDANGYAAREDAQALRCLMSSQSKPRGHQRGVSKSKMKTIKLTLAVVLCYLLCWAPWFVANMATAWNESIRFEGPAMTIIALLASFNSCTNPWIYLAFSGRTCTKSDRRISRSWTRSTHVATTTADSESRSRTSMYDLSRCSSREASPWTKDHPSGNSSC